MNKAKLTSYAAFSLAFFSFFPFPAIQIGKGSGLQLGSVIAVVTVIARFRTISRQWLIFYALFVAFITTSILLNLLIRQSFDLELGLKYEVVMSLALVTALATTSFLPNNTREITNGVASALIIHGIFGLFQYFSFQNNNFFFPQIFINPSFQDLTSIGIQEELSLYVKRPFGIFPEPSAMAACVVPWLVYLLAILLQDSDNALVGKRKSLFYLSFFLGSVLVFLSLSGGILFYCFGFVIILMNYGWTSLKHRKVLPAMIMTFLVLSVVVTGYTALEDRFTLSLTAGQSWFSRYSSISESIAHITKNDVVSLLLGVGPGQGAITMKLLGKYEAVWSILFNFIFENGLAGVFLLFLLIKKISWSDMNLLSLTCMCILAFSVTLLTSYYTLLPLWLTLAFFIPQLGSVQRVR